MFKNVQNVGKSPQDRDGKHFAYKGILHNQISAEVCPQACESINNLEDDCTVC